ncbi:MAG: mercuric ion binding protein [Flavobacteriales bacterium]|jgi:mercuric ion binding protein
MKKLLFPFALLVLSILPNEILAQKKVMDETFWVGGVCGMCEDRIEKALDVKGVKLADYDYDAQMLRVVYKTKMMNRAKLDVLLNAVGHDTKTSIASDEQYDGVHGCCKYRDPAVQDQHKEHGDEGEEHDDHDEDEKH